ncbi:MAG TPA: hypothetical protein VHX60_08250 [Acidobacteriaceae bacterium]|jgi:hypothetical protein|nr:hypothetical protein [Acidobacteriaceae bacterium]
MAKVTILFGLVLIALGIVGFVSTGSQHPTALIPAYFGLALGILGVLARTENPKRRMLVMHIAVTLGLLGFLGTAKSVWDYWQMERGATFPYPAAVEAKATMAVIMLFYVLLCVRSFISARRSRPAA